MADGGSSNKRRNIRVRTPFLRKLVEDVRENARRLAASDDAADGEGEPADSDLRGDEAAQGDEQLAPVASVSHEEECAAVATGDDGRAVESPRGSSATPRKQRSKKRRNDAANDNAVQVSGLKPYLSIADLAARTPWSEQAIRTMMSRGVFQEGKHYFHVGRRPVFKWEAIVRFIQLSETDDFDPIPHYRDKRSSWEDEGK